MFLVFHLFVQDQFNVSIKVLAHYKVQTNVQSIKLALFI